MTRERTLLLAEGALTAAFLGVGVTAVGIQPTWSHGFHLLVGVAFAVVAFVLAFVVVRHAPGNVVGPILGAVGLVAVLTAATDVYSYVAADGDLPLSPYVVAFGQGIWMLLYLPFAALLLWFPGRTAARAALAACPGRVRGRGGAVQRAARPRRRAVPRAVRGPPTPRADVLLVVPGGSGPAARPDGPAGRLRGGGGGALAAGRRRGAPAAALAAARVRVLPLTLLLCWLSYLVLGTADLVVVGLAFMYVAFPAAAAIAVVRHDLYDVDRAVVLAAVYGVLGTGLLLAFTVASAAAGLVAGGDSTAVALVVTAGCGVLLGGQRGRLTHAVGTRLYPARERARAAIAGLRARVHAGDAVPEQLEPTLRVALGDPGLRVGHVAPHLDFCVDRDGREVVLTDGWEPVILAGHRAGVLVPGRPTPRWLLHYVAGEAALLVEPARLRLELAHALQQVEASRERLVRASDEERKKLELDLHDGAQQRLVSLGMSLRLAQRHLGDGTVDVDAVIDGRWPSWAPRSRSCGRSRTACGPAASTTGWPPPW
jgi:signal transduction histidine kinase